MHPLLFQWVRAWEELVGLRPAAREETTKAVRASRLPVLPETYLALSYVAATLAATGTLLATPVVLALAADPGGASGFLLTLASAGAAFAFVRLGFLLYPRLRASSRAAHIEEEFPSVAVLAYALARGGMHVLDIFRAIAEEEDTFGELSVEFALVARETDVFGADIMSAIRDVARTTPSASLRGFLEGLVTIMNSGADPRDYLKRQAETQLAQTEVRMQREVDQAGLLAEVYVSGLLVLPLLLIVILTVLSAINGSSAVFVPLIIFGFIPLCTFAYLLLVEVLMPADKLDVPPPERLRLSDFGMGTVRVGDELLPPPRPRTLKELAEDLEANEAQGEDMKRLRRRLVVEHVRQRALKYWRDFASRAVYKPSDALDVSGTAALLLLLVGGLGVWFGGRRGDDLVVSFTTLLLAATLVAVVPVSVFHEIRLRRARRVAGALPEMLSKLSGFNERGIGLVQSFHLMGRSTTGPLANELRQLERDLTWNSSLRGGLQRMRARVKTLAMTKLTVLFTRASAATGNLKDVLDVAAQDARRTQTVRQRKQQAMSTYVIIIYVVFAVFLYVIYLVADLFYGDQSLLVAASSAPGAPGGGGGMEAVEARLMFFHAVLLQAVCCGFVAGKLGEGHLLSGLKHAALLVLVAWSIFRYGVVA